MRLTKDDYFLKMLQLIANRSTCIRRKAGAIIINEAGHILATGYNGVAQGQKHCLDFPCTGANDVSGDTSRCEAIHAEQNALLQCFRLDLAHTIYVSVSPCFVCAKLILNTPIKRVVAEEIYSDDRCIQLFQKNGLSLEIKPSVLYEWECLEQVREFFIKHGHFMQEFPSVSVPKEVQVLRLRLMMEELGELSSAIHENDLIKIADGISDLLVVTLGTALVYGLPLRKVFNEIHKSNMSKAVAAKIELGEKYGEKIGKGVSFVKPNLQFLLDEKENK